MILFPCSEPTRPDDGGSRFVSRLSGSKNIGIFDLSGVFSKSSVEPHFPCLLLLLGSVVANDDH